MPVTRVRLVHLVLVCALMATSGTAVAGPEEFTPVGLTRTVHLEAEAIALAAAFDAVPVAENGAGCPRPRLRVQWSEPGPFYELGAFVTPVGPAPGPQTERVNGIVICRGSTYAYMGFEAVLVDGEWVIETTPAVAEGGHGEPPNLDAEPHADHAHEDHPVEAPPAEAPADPPAADAAPPAVLPAPVGTGADIDGYAAYQAQTSCDPSAKPGVLGFRDLAMGGYPGSRNLGITRGCGVGGRSEHKEGRAFDWGVLVSRAGEKAAADDLIARLLATDEHGNAHALARRMGVMYVIWNHQIWSAYRHQEGWRPYRGASAHTDHVHISFSWAGARAETSYWSGRPVPTGIDESTPSMFDVPRSGGGGGGGGSHGRSLTPEERAARDAEKAAVRAAWEAEKETRRLEREARDEARRAEREAKKAAWEAEKEARRVERHARDEARRLEKEAKEAAWEAEKEARRLEREARDEARRAEREAKKAAWEAEKERRRLEREARDEARRLERERRRHGSTTTTVAKPVTTTTTTKPATTTTTSGATTTSTAPAATTTTAPPTTTTAPPASSSPSSSSTTPTTAPG